MSISNIDKIREKIEKLKKLADAMYYAAQYLTTDASRLHKAMDEYHKFIIREYKEEHVSDELGEYINELSKQFPEVSFAKLSRIAVRVAKWQKEHLWKPADGDDLPIIDREVIALLDNGKVVFAHRPPEFWDGKNIITGKVTRNYPKTYDKGGWNIPNVKWWLDVDKLPNVED